MGFKNYILHIYDTETGRESGLRNLVLVERQRRESEEIIYESKSNCKCALGIA